jgi:CRP-like cAMP-binding protein
MLCAKSGFLACLSGAADPAAGDEDVIGTVMRIDRDGEIFAEGEDSDFAYRIEHGVVRICKLHADGRRQVSEFLRRGDWFGLEELGPHLFAAEAVTNVVLVRFPRKQIETFAADRPVVDRKLRDLVCDRWRRAQTRLVVLGRLSARERLAAFLLEMRDVAGNGMKIELPMTRVDIADHLCLTIETVSRMFSMFRSEGLIELPAPQSVVLRNPDQLASVASL